MERKIVVIGGGPGGIEAALTAARAGSAVTLITKQAIGGRAAWESLLPGKGRLAQRDASAIWSAQQQAALTDAGVWVIWGKAAFESTHRIHVIEQHGATESIDADAVIVATGSQPIFSPGFEPDGAYILAPHHIYTLKTLPKDIIVIGAGGPATEYVYLFTQLGVSVTWIIDQNGALPFFPRDAVNVLVETLIRRGVRTHQGQRAAHIECEQNRVMVLLEDGTAYRAEAAFVALGQQPDTAPLNLRAAGVATSPYGALIVDEFCQTNIPSVYGVGDVTGAGNANMSMAQGRIAGRHASGAQVEPLQRDSLVFALHTDPDVGMVGQTNGETFVQIPFKSALKAQLLPESDGFLRLHYDEENGQIVGAVAVGTQAADVLAIAALAIRLRAKLDDLASLYVGHPSLSELPFIAARAVAR